MDSSGCRSDVILPIYICPSVIKAVQICGLIPKFVPVSSNLTIQHLQLSKYLNENTLAVLVPHINGYPASIDKCVDIIRNFSPSIRIIDDAASALGHQVNEKYLGTYGDVGIISFAQAKMTPGYGGGVLIVNNDEFKEIFNYTLSMMEQPNRAREYQRLFECWWKIRMVRYSKNINYYITKYLYTNRKLRVSNSWQMSTQKKNFILFSFRDVFQIKKNRSAIINFYIEQLGDEFLCDFPQELAAEYSVTRLLFRIRGIQAQRNDNNILTHHPLVEYLEKNGIRAGYGYGYPVCPDSTVYCSGIKKYFDELIWLPVDCKKEVSDYKYVTKTIKDWIDQYTENC